MITREIERAGIPVAHITAMSLLSKQTGAHRIVTAVKIPHPCGDPELSADADHAVRREIVKTALEALQTDVSESTIFEPKITATIG